VEQFKKFISAPAIFCIAVCVRLCLLIPAWQYPERLTAPDTESYAAIAANLLGGNGYSSCPEAPFRPDVYRTPVYPVFMAVVFGIGGLYDYRALVLAQILLDAFSAMLLFHTGRRLFGNRAAWQAGLFFAFALNAAALSVTALSETLCAFLLTLQLFYLARNRGTDPWKSALCWTLAVLCRPLVVVTLPCWILFLVLKKTKPRICLSLIIPALLPLLMWCFRNERAGGYRMLSSVTAINRLQYDAAALLAWRLQKPLVETRAQLEALARQKAGAEPNACLNDNSWIPVYQNLGDSILCTAPARFAALRVRGSLNAALPALNYALPLCGFVPQGRNTLDVLQNRGIAAAFQHYFGAQWRFAVLFLPWALLWVFFMATAAFGALRLAHNRSYAELALWAGGAVCLFAPAGMAAEPRFSVPAIPFLVLCTLARYNKQKHV
jgi:4-amino-4-deoxy-L-arabinose transferase-like glycosyltransferase